MLVARLQRRLKKDKLMMPLHQRFRGPGDRLDRQDESWLMPSFRLGAGRGAVAFGSLGKTRTELGKLGGGEFTTCLR